MILLNKKKNIQTAALSFIVLMGIVSLFSDMTHEGAKSILGDFLSLAGASAAVIGFISGLGEMIGYSLRLLSGRLADRTKHYWTITIIGYIIDVAAIPALALVTKNGWILACVFVIVEKAAKALKKPAKDTLLSFAAAQNGVGKSFAIQEFLDQIGAFLGPVILFLTLLARQAGDTFANYRFCFLILGIPGAITVLLLFVAKRKFPNPENFEPEPKEKEPPLTMNKAFVLYIIGISLFAFGFIDFTLITLRTARTGLIPEDTLPLLYAGAMAVDAFSALFFGWLFDRSGVKALAFSTLLSAPFAVFIFLFNGRWALFVGAALWGVGMGAQESILKAAVTKLIPKSNRSSGFGIFQTFFGVSWFLGSWLMGVLYDASMFWMAIISMLVQLLAIPFYLKAYKVYGNKE